MDILIENGVIIDGSGHDRYLGDVWLKDDRIYKIGTGLGGEFPKASGEVVDARGKYVIPGLIDMHSHADVTMPAYPGMENYLVQGVTTLSVGHCSMGLAPIDEYYASQCLEDLAYQAIGEGSKNGYNPGQPIVAETARLRPIFKETLGFDLDWTTWKEFMDHMQKEGVGCNIRGYVSFGMIRLQAMHGDCARSATPEEIEEMRRLLVREMEGGAHGMHCGFDYMPDLYATPEEVAAVASVLKDYDAVLEAHTQHSKLRYGKMWPEHKARDGIRELMDIGKAAGVAVHISHIPDDYLGAPEIDEAASEVSAREILEMIRQYQADGLKVTFDVIPPDCMSMLYYPQMASFFMPLLLQEGGMTPFSRRLAEDERYRQWILECIRQKHLDEVCNIYPTFRRFLSDPEGKRTRDIVVTHTAIPQVTGKTLGELEELWKMSVPEVILEILAKDPQASYHSSHVPSISGGEHVFIADSEASVGFDSVAADFSYNVAGPDFPLDTCPPNDYNFTVKYLTENKLDRFEDAIYKASGRSADILGLKDRGRIAEGMKADVVILNPDTLAPHIDFVEPRRAPSGIEAVFVNGVAAVRDGRLTGARAGEVL